MALSKANKQAQVEALQALAEKAVAVTVAENHGVSSNDMNKLRKNAREQDVVLMVAKNTLSRRVFQNHNNLSVLCGDLQNPVMLGFSLNELSSGAKLLGNYAKENKRLTVKSVAIDGVRYGQEQLKYVMNLPTREQAIAMVAAGIQSPLVQFTGVLQEVYGQFARVLHAVAEQKKAD